MSEKWTLAEVFDAYPGGIKVPRIQRGYVQGRNDAKGEAIRAEFGPALVDAVFGGKELSLDFVYGVASEDGEGRRVLMPLDGQQRITTLLLLAWLCGKWDGAWRFDYEARRIPQLFAEGLREHRRQGTGVPSTGIGAAAWFLPVWANDPTVAGMLRMLDALDQEIGGRDRASADFSRVTFLLHGIDGNSATFDHVFRKMNARGKELSAWENLKALLDKHLPREIAGGWREKVDNDWAETIWPNVGRNVVSLDNAMEKVARMVYARFAGDGTQGNTLWQMETRLRDDVATREAFFKTAERIFDSLETLATCWSEDRTCNALWGGQGDGEEFWKWLADGRGASRADQLRIAFLAEPSDVPDEKRRRRVLLNLLDASSFDSGTFAMALETGLAFLAGRAGIGGLGGFAKAQVEDETRKWGLDEAAIAGFEKDELVWCGSLRFIGWAPFADAADIFGRLSGIREAIRADWIGFYRNLAARIPEDAIAERAYLHAPVRQDDMGTWRENVLSDAHFVRALASWHDSPGEPGKVACWAAHLCKLLADGKVFKPTLRKIGGWMFLLQTDRYRSANSIRLDWNETERTNRQLLKAGAIFYATPWPWAEGKDAGEWFKIDDVSWWESDDPPRWGRGADGTFFPLSDPCGQAGEDESTTNNTTPTGETT